MENGKVRISGIFSGLIAILALAVSLASAGWSVFAYYKSSEVRSLPFESVTFMNQDGVAQVAIEISVANLAFGEYDDVARHQELLLDTGARQIRFVAQQTASVRPLTRNSDGTLETVSYPCRQAGALVAACVIAETPVVSLPAGSVETIYPVFELAETDCGLDECGVMTVAQLAEVLTQTVRSTYTVFTMRDGEHTLTCELDIRPGDAEYFAEAGFFTPRCKEAAS